MIDSNSQFYAILTNVGVAKQANADVLGIAWKITHMGVGDANDTDPQPSATQKMLINEWRRAPLNQLIQDATNPAIIIAEQVIPAEVGGKWIREIGLYDADGDLVAVANCAPSFKPLLAQGSGRTQVVRMNLIVSNSAIVELKIDPSVVLATREFVTSELARQDFKSSVLVCTPGNIALSGLQTIDGVAVTVGKRVLVAKQTAAKDNGIWVAAAGAWARAADADKSEKVTPGLLVHVEQGTLYGDSGWQLVTDGVLSLGVTALSFEMAWGRTGVMAGTYRSVTVDKYGRVVAATNPTTVAGYGLTDVYTMAQLDAALLQKADLNSPVLIGAPKAPTAPPGTNTQQLANPAFVQTALAALVNSSPAALDTLNELALALGNDPNFSTTMATVLGLKAPLASPTFTGDPKAPTAPPGTNTQQLANTAFVQTAIAELIASSPSTLNTLNELAVALGNDPNFATTMATQLGLKAPLASPTFTGDPRAPTAAVGDNDKSIANTEFVQSALAAYGLAPKSPTVSDLDALRGTQFFRFSSNSTGALLPGSTYDAVGFQIEGEGQRTQFGIDYGGRLFIRTDDSADASGFADWVLQSNPDSVNQQITANTRRYTGAGVGVSASLTLTAANLGSWINATLAGMTITLPASSGIADGQIYQIRNQSPGTVNIVHSGAGAIQQETGVKTDTLILAKNEWVELAASGTSYWITGRGKTEEVVTFDQLGDRVGECTHFAMSTPPAGYLKRNGAAVSRTTYSALFAKIGTLYGAGNGTTTFNLPDSRGYFDRGWDDSRGTDTGRVFGSNQDSANLFHGHIASAVSGGAHTHTTTLPREYVPPTSSSDVNAVYGDQTNEGTASITTSSNGAHTHVITVNGAGDNESRPVNTAFLACIKY